MSLRGQFSQNVRRTSRKADSLILGSSHQRMSASSSMVKPHRSSSVYNISTRSGRISSVNYGSNKSGTYGGFYSSGMLAPFSINEKQTMQNLNERLSNYLEKVRSLEKSNGELEGKIREYYENRSPASFKEMGDYWKTIHDLRTQINAASLNNAKILLQIDNAKLAADDFKTKYDSELAIRRGVELDINGLRKVLDELTIARTDLESQIEAMKEEMTYTKKNHEEELKSLRSQIRGKVTVDVDSSPGEDLTKVLAEMREKYEEMAAKNQKDAETWFKEQSVTLNQKMDTNTRMVHREKDQLTESRRRMQAVEIDLQTMLSVKSSLENNLQEMEDHYADQLFNLQNILSQRESELSQVLVEMNRHSQEYSQLVDIKTRLEIEISTYRRLLDGQDMSYSTEISSVETTREPEVVTTRKVVTITETIIDGKIVASHQEESVAPS
ncbi:keratin, type I cytoskeletal 19-like [Narcine bancroftii]|uniref:keratin, type I cytoskeletal 19-like n=1 Tax=Narcine bancroftii TaxID=1343680 RepID=UPI003831B3EE